MILVDIDGTLLPHADNKFRHLYHCECGYGFMATSLDKGLPVFCSSCGGSTFKRNELSLAECRSIVKEVLSRNIPPYPGAAECLRRLAQKHSIIYITGRDKIFFQETESWLFSNGFPCLPPHKLIMRESDNDEVPCLLKTSFIESLDRKDGLLAIIDDDLSLIAVAKRERAQFIWAPTCWEKNTYYGNLLEHL